jgi:hypothetical protein
VSQQACSGFKIWTHCATVAIAFRFVRHQLGALFVTGQGHGQTESEQKAQQNTQTVASRFDHWLKFRADFRRPTPHPKAKFWHQNQTDRQDRENIFDFLRTSNEKRQVGV